MIQSWQAGEKKTFPLCSWQRMEAVTADRNTNALWDRNEQILRNKMRAADDLYALMIALLLILSGLKDKAHLMTSIIDTFNHFKCVINVMEI